MKSLEHEIKILKVELKIYFIHARIKIDQYKPNIPLT